MRVWFALALFLMLAGACNPSQNTTSETEKLSAVGEKDMKTQKYDPPQNGVVGKVEKTDEEWKKELSPQEYYVLRQAGTERAFSGEFWDNKRAGVYTCGACGLPLFSSETKFKSGTGWPSFYEPIKPEYIIERTDNSLGMSRTEVLCARCGGHLGHVFNDGPEPTGLRYCLNSISLDFIPQEKLAQQETAGE